MEKLLLPNKNNAKAIAQLICDKMDCNISIVDTYEIDNKYIVSLSYGLKVVFEQIDTKQYLHILKGTSLKKYFTILCNGFSTKEISKYLQYLDKFTFVKYLSKEVLCYGTITDILQYCDENNIEYKTHSTINNNFFFSYSFYSNGTADFEINGYRNY